MKLSMFSSMLDSFDSNFDLVDKLITDSYSSIGWKFEEGKASLYLTLPGFSKEDFEITFDSNYLYVKASQDKSKKYLANVASYKSTFSLYENFDLATSGSSYQDGILHIWFGLKITNPNTSKNKIEVK